MTNPFIGQITLFAGNFAPRAFAFCEGQLLAIASNTALFSILGTTYGGDGRTTFALPDLRGRVSVSPGTGPGLSTWKLGQFGGVEEVTLNLLQLPSHTHFVASGSATMHTSAAADSASPDGNYFAPDAAAPPYGSTRGTGSMAADVISLSSLTLANTGGGGSHENRRPFLALNYIIAMQGTYPSRS